VTRGRTSTRRRTVARVDDKLDLGSDAQVDQKAMWFTPRAPALTFEKP